MMEKLSRAIMQVASVDVRQALSGTGEELVRNRRDVPRGRVRLRVILYGSAPGDRLQSST